MNQRVKKRIAPEVAGIQINFCQNPNCENYGLSPAIRGKDARFTIVGVGKLQTGYKCKACGTISQVKSNLAIAEELRRITHPHSIARAVRQTGYSCPNPECENFLVKIADQPNRYRKRGSTSQGNPKRQCRSCGKLFTLGSTKFREQVHNYQASHIAVFRHLAEGIPLRGIMRLHDTTMEEIYRKIDMFSERCFLFAHERESRIANLSIERMKLSSDKQDYLVNWTNRKDKKTTAFSAIGTADRDSGYVFGMEVTYDNEISMSDVLSDDEYVKDLTLKIPFRRYARIWTPDEIRNMQFKDRPDLEIASHVDELKIFGQIAEGDRSALEFLQENRLPGEGAQVHSEYTQYAHFLKLAHTLRNVERLNIYTDLEAGIANAINLAFLERNRTAT